MPCSSKSHCRTSHTLYLAQLPLQLPDTFRAGLNASLLTIHAAATAGKDAAMLAHGHRLAPQQVYVQDGQTKQAPRPRVQKAPKKRAKTSRGRHDNTKENVSRPCPQTACLLAWEPCTSSASYAQHDHRQVLAGASCVPGAATILT